MNEPTQRKSEASGSTTGMVPIRHAFALPLASRRLLTPDVRGRTASVGTTTSMSSVIFQKPGTGYPQTRNAVVPPISCPALRRGTRLSTRCCGVVCGLTARTPWKGRCRSAAATRPRPTPAAVAARTVKVSPSEPGSGDRRRIFPASGWAKRREEEGVYAAAGCGKVGCTWERGGRLRRRAPSADRVGAASAPRRRCVVKKARQGTPGGEYLTTVGASGPARAGALWQGHRGQGDAPGAR